MEEGDEVNYPEAFKTKTIDKNSSVYKEKRNILPLILIPLIAITFLLKIGRASCRERV